VPQGEFEVGLVQSIPCQLLVDSRLVPVGVAGGHHVLCSPFVFNSGGKSGRVTFHPNGLCLLSPGQQVDFSEGIRNFVCGSEPQVFRRNNCDEKSAGFFLEVDSHVQITTRR